MYRDYVSVNGRTFTSDEKGIHEKETHDKIEEELSLENEIEALNSEIAILEKNKAKLGTIKKNNINRIVSYLLGIAIILFTIFLCKEIHLILGIPDMEIATPRISFVRTFSDALLFIMLPVSFIFTTPYTIIEPHRYRKNNQKILTIEEQLEYLNSELSKKKEELETLRNNISKKEVIEDSEITTINNSKYRADLADKLALLESIRKYKKKLEKYLDDGTLREELIQIGVKPENIAFAEEALSRTLSKK